MKSNSTTALIANHTLNTRIMKISIKTLVQRVSLAAAALALCMTTSAQDAHFSQFDASPVLNNPAMTGMYDYADFRLGTNFRSQWGRLTNSFVTTALSFDMPVNERFGAGGHFINYDQGGVLNTFNLGFSGAYNLVDPRADYMITTGLQAGFIYKKINDSDLLFDNQYGDGYFDSKLPSGETFEKGGRLMPNFDLGVGYKSTDDNKRLNPFVNVSAYHLTSPDENILSEEKSELPIRWSINGGALIEVNDMFYLKPLVLFQKQRNSQELNIGVLGEYELDGTVYNIVGGVAHRLKDATILHLGLKHGLNTYRFSYDINSSGLGEFTGRKGAIEFSIIYCGTHNGRSAKRTGGGRF